MRPYNHKMHNNTGMAENKKGHTERRSYYFLKTSSGHVSSFKGLPLLLRELPFATLKERSPRSRLMDTRTARRVACWHKTQKSLVIGYTVTIGVSE